MYPGFEDEIRRFNTMYRLGPVDLSTPAGVEHIGNWVDILHEECLEGYEAHSALVNKQYGDDVLSAKTDLADWLADVLIYTCTEAARLDIPLAKVVQIVMQSNFSKLGLDGQPIYDSRGKVQKGAAFEPPEPRIRQLLELHSSLGEAAK